RGVSIGQVAMSETGSTSGDSRGFAFEVGYDISDSESDWQYGPRLAYQYASSDIDSFEESGESITALGFGNQTQKSKRAEVGVFASYFVDRISFDMEAGLLSDLEDRTRDIRMWQLALPEADSYYLPAYSTQRTEG